MSLKSGYFLMVTVFGLSVSPCTKKPDEKVLDKIGFDYSHINDSGLLPSGVAVDYEFCIPGDDHHLEEVLDIDDTTKVMKSSKRRIGCTTGQWLCIVSTHHPEWKNRLYAIASLSYVEKIQQTYYE